MRAKIRKATLVVVFLVLGLNLSLQAEGVYEEWIAYYDGGMYSWDDPQKIVVDRYGNAYVTGTSATIKYLPNGDTAWIRSGYIGGSDLVLDEAGYIYVVGGIYNLGGRYCILKFSPDGNVLWQRCQPGIGEAIAISLDKDENVCVTGTGALPGSTSRDFVTAKYSPNGETLWTKTYDGPSKGSDYTRDVGVDKNGNVFVTGMSWDSVTGFDYATVKYSTEGDELWVRRENNPADNGTDNPAAIAVDDSGNVYVTGTSFSWAQGDDYLTIKYSSQGSVIWQNFWNCSGDVAYAMSLDADKEVTVGGFGCRSIETLRLDSNGDTVWSTTFKECESYDYIDYAAAVVTDSLGNAYVCGMACQYSGGLEIVTLKYSQSGETIWSKSYGGYGEDFGKSIAIDGKGGVYVVGQGEVLTGQNYMTAKYSPCIPSSPKSADASADDSLSIADVVSVISYLFGYSVPPTCDDNQYDCWVYQRLCRYDWNGDKKITLGDCVRGLNFIFNRPGGPWDPVASLGCCPFP